MKEFAYDMPDQKLLSPYRVKVAMGFLYANGFGSLLLWTGEKYAALILFVPLFLYSVILNGPNYAKTQTVFGRQEQSWYLDLILMASCVMMTGSHLCIASTKKEEPEKQKRAF